MAESHGTVVGMTQLSVGDPAPPFDLPTSDRRLDLEHFRGRWLVLYFYPADFTPGCTTEACDFRDRLPGLDAAVVGVSPDPPERHAEFASSHGLPFPLLSDEDHALAESYGAWGEKTNYGRSYQGLIRSTFIIDPEGGVAEALYNVQASGHAERVAARLSEMQAAARP
jgi:peroxiredoxin Q/BCP